MKLITTTLLLGLLLSSGCLKNPTVQVKATTSASAEMTATEKYVYLSPTGEASLEVYLPFGKVYDISTSRHPGPWCLEIEFGVDVQNWVQVHSKEPSWCELKISESPVESLRIQQTELPPSGQKHHF